MTNEQLEKKISDAFAGAVPDVFDDIMEDIRKETGSGGENASPKKKKKNRNLIKIITAIAVAAAVILTIVGISASRAGSVLAATVSLDVNPGIEISVNKKHKVLSVIPTTDDARDVIGDMDFTGTNLDVTVNALVGAMLSKGYLSDISNSILISVDSPDSREAVNLQNQLLGEVNALLENDDYKAAILSQTISDDAGLRALAQEYGITVGKAQLINDIISKTGRYKFEDLVALSINELNLLEKSSPEKLTSIGVASDKAYIGNDKAKEIAAADSKVSINDMADLKVEMEYENSIMIYEVDFRRGDTKYEYDINALTGTIVKTEKETNKTGQDNNGGQSGSQSSGQSQSGSAGQSSGGSGSSGSSGSANNNNSSQSSNKPAIQPATQAQTQAPKATTKAQTKSATQPATQKATTKAANNSSGGSKSRIGEAKAKSIAFGHAGVSGGQVRDFDIELDGNVYEIDFKAGKYEYDYEIDAYSGKVISVDKEYDD